MKNLEFNQLLEKVENRTLEIEYAHEMSSEINDEFNPPIDYSSLVPYIESYGWDITAFLRKLEEEANSSISSENDIFFWDTPEGYLFQQINQSLETLKS